MPWITFHGTFQRFIAPDGKYVFQKPIIQFVIVLDEVTKQQHPFICMFFNFTMPQKFYFTDWSHSKLPSCWIILSVCFWSPHPCPIPILSLPPHKGHFQEMHGVYAGIEFVYFRFSVRNSTCPLVRDKWLFARTSKQSVGSYPLAKWKITTKCRLPIKRLWGWYKSGPLRMTHFTSTT